MAGNGGQCPKCGAKVYPGDTQCLDCGQTLAQSAQPGASRDRRRARAEEARQVKRSRGKLIAIVAVAAVVLVAGGFGLRRAGASFRHWLEFGRVEEARRLQEKRDFPEDSRMAIRNQEKPWLQAPRAPSDAGPIVIDNVLAVGDPEPMIKPFRENNPGLEVTWPENTNCVIIDARLPLRALTKVEGDAPYKFTLPEIALQYTSGDDYTAALLAFPHMKPTLILYTADCEVGYGPAPDDTSGYVPVRMAFAVSAPYTDGQGWIYFRGLKSETFDIKM